MTCVCHLPLAMVGRSSFVVSNRVPFPVVSWLQFVASVFVRLAIPRRCSFKAQHSVSALTRVIFSLTSWLLYLQAHDVLITRAGITQRVSTRGDHGPEKRRIQTLSLPLVEFPFRDNGSRSATTKPTKRPATPWVTPLRSIKLN